MIQLGAVWICPKCGRKNRLPPPGIRIMAIVPEWDYCPGCMRERVPCPVCHGERRVFVETKRLIGATYSFDDPWKGDEHYEVCPFCGGDFFMGNVCTGDIKYGIRIKEKVTLDT